MLLVSGFVVVGAFGVVRYVWTFWLYRGYPPPVLPTSVRLRTGAGGQTVTVSPGVVEHITVRARALGGELVPVTVFLPSRYAAQATTRYPVFYLLHGFPGNPSQFVDIGDIATDADTLLAARRIRPMILVMPSGSDGFFKDTEWANSLLPDSNWETFVARDLVDAVDARYRTLRSGSARAIGGLSEGAYGALNIAFHHPGEFDLIEGWSPYYTADNKPAFFGGRAGLLSYNSPSLELASVAAKLRRAHTFVWIYSGVHDFANRGSTRLAAKLQAFSVSHQVRVELGDHNWALWRRMMPTALEVASEHLSYGQNRA